MLLDRHSEHLEELASQAMHAQRDAILRQLPGLFLESARQIVAEVGSTGRPKANAFPVSWCGPPKPRPRPKGAICKPSSTACFRAWASPKSDVGLAHRLCRLMWKLLHDRVRYLEHGIIIDPRTRLRALARLGYHVHIREPARISAERVIARTWSGDCEFMYKQLARLVQGLGLPRRRPPSNRIGFARAV
jgi:hypothetical protein